MKNLLVLLFAISATAARALDAGVCPTVYQTPDGKAYLEVQIEIAADPKIYHWVDSAHVKMSASVEAVLLLKQGETVVLAEKYALNSPTTLYPVALLDIRRFNVAGGDYTLDIQFSDLQKAGETARFTQKISVDAAPDRLFVSQPVLVGGYRPDESTGSPFVKNGYYLEPLPFRFFQKNSTRLIFYQEIVHSDRQPADEYLVRYFIEHIDANGKADLAAIGNRRCKPSPIEVLLVQMDISKLGSGDYRLTTEVRNRANELLAAKSVDFQRSNPAVDRPFELVTQEVADKGFVKDLSADDLKYSLRALLPKLEGDETQVHSDILKRADPAAMRLFLFNYWAKQNPSAPKTAYDDYMALARQIDVTYRSGFGYGFETDRGLRYLKYGKPSDILSVEDDPTAPPYEIWVYNDFPATRQALVKFLFYNPSLTPGDYILLHSNARGEFNNPRWQRQLYKNTPNDWTDGDIIDGTGVQRNVNRRAAEFMSDF